MIIIKAMTLDKLNPIHLLFYQQNMFWANKISPVKWTQVKSAQDNLKQTDYTIEACSVIL